MTIGTVAKKAEVNVQTIRYYERKNLVLPISRSQSGYRQYSGEAVRRVLFIKHAQSIGFTLKEIESLLSLQVNPRSTCGDVKAHAEEKIKDIDVKIRKLRDMRAALGTLIKRCDDDLPLTECPIIEALEEV